MAFRETSTSIATPPQTMPGTNIPDYLAVPDQRPKWLVSDQPRLRQAHISSHQHQTRLPAQRAIHRSCRIRQGKEKIKRKGYWKSQVSEVEEGSRNFLREENKKI
ncbi:hypothetical protein J6590_103541, partial [Homalodisca vitripennis]